MWGLTDKRFSVLLSLFNTVWIDFRHLEDIRHTGISVRVVDVLGVMRFYSTPHFLRRQNALFAWARPKWL